MKPNIQQKQVETKFLLPFLEEMFAAGKQVRMTVTGISMFPMLRDRTDSVLLQRAEKVKKFDIILFVRTTGEAVMHRIVACSPEGYTLLGDNQIDVEGPIKEEQVMAKVVGFYHGDYYVSCKTWWYRIYSILWGSAKESRKWLYPLAIRVARVIKRLKRMEK